MRAPLPKTGFYNVEDGISAEAVPEGAILSAIGDVNNDKYQDLITISDDRTSFREHILNKKTYFYESSDEIPADCTIQNIEVPSKPATTSAGAED